MDVVAIYTGDSTNFHIFQILEEEGKHVVGTLYFDKRAELPEACDVNLVTPSRDKFLWEKKAKELLNELKPGSKGERRLKKVIASY